MRKERKIQMNGKIITIIFFDLIMILLSFSLTGKSDSLETVCIIQKQMYTAYMFIMLFVDGLYLVKSSMPYAQGLGFRFFIKRHIIYSASVLLTFLIFILLDDGIVTGIGSYSLLYVIVMWIILGLLMERKYNSAYYDES